MRIIAPRLFALALGAIFVIDGNTVEQDGVRWRLVGIDAVDDMA